MTQIWGTQPDAIDEAEDRDRWMDCLNRLDIKQPPGGMVTTEADALKTSAGLGYPVSTHMHSILASCWLPTEPAHSNHLCAYFGYCSVRILV